METIKDIVEEMRAKTAKSKDEAWYDQSSWATLCDRLQIAHCAELITTRQDVSDNGREKLNWWVSQVAKMLKALMAIDDLLKESRVEKITMAATLATIAEVVDEVLADDVAVAQTETTTQPYKEATQPYKPTCMDFLQVDGRTYELVEGTPVLCGGCAFLHNKKCVFPCIGSDKVWKILHAVSAQSRIDNKEDSNESN